MPAKSISAISLTLRLLLSFSAPAAAVGPVGAAGPIWRSPECVDCPQTSFVDGDHNLAIDSGGRLHLTYAGDQPVYAYYNGTTWLTETLGNVIVIRFSRKRTAPMRQIRGKRRL